MVPLLVVASAKTMPISLSGVAAVGGGGGVGGGAGGEGGGAGIDAGGDAAPSEHAVSETLIARASTNPKQGFIALTDLPSQLALITTSNWN